jgi:multisubunit Na+/H+ antiporter MnhB subunit
MNDFPWILVAISLGLILALLAVAVLRRRKEPRHIDYRNYFVMGIIWLAFTPVMILLPWILHGEEPSLGFSFFFVMGLAYVIIGLRNRDKWGKKVEVSTTASRNMIGIIGVLVLIFILGIVVLTLYG